MNTLCQLSRWRIREVHSRFFCAQISQICSHAAQIIEMLYVTTTTKIETTKIVCETTAKYCSLQTTGD